MGAFDVTRIFLKVQNPTTKLIKVSVKEIYSDFDLILQKRTLCTFDITPTYGFETFIVETLHPTYNTRFKLVMEEPALLYIDQLGFLGYLDFCTFRSGDLYYDKSDYVIIKDNTAILHNQDYITYDVELKDDNLFYLEGIYK